MMNEAMYGAQTRIQRFGEKTLKEAFQLMPGALDYTPFNETNIDPKQNRFVKKKEKKEKKKEQRENETEEERAARKARKKEKKERRKAKELAAAAAATAAAITVAPVTEEAMRSTRGKGKRKREEFEEQEQEQEQEEEQRIVVSHDRSTRRQSKAIAQQAREATAGGVETTIQEGGALKIKFKRQKTDE
eukprot:TRINITY_DN2193_c0_g1_i6.p2 TRINITY_DN2193_c0_g1~~TRINITY_DN2193_c0_g1_i6.p2  ORF type:complete len:189 (-),score=67.88 TRINITY_DN2193_c0_g1_i6:168-734(-)